MPDMPAPAAPAAPSAPAAPAPSSSPAPSPAPAPAPAAPVPPPSAPAVPGTPDSPAPIPTAPGAPDAQAIPPATVPDESGEPKQENYSNDAAGLEQFLNDRNAWREKNPPPDANKPEGEAPAPALAAPAAEEAPKPAEPVKDAAAPSPQKLDEWTTKSPALKAALDADPDLKGEIFAMARLNERAKPVLDLVGTVENAQFAIDNANAFVELRTGLMLSVEDPERMPETFDKLQDLFRIKDDKGEYVKDAAGNFQMAEDYNLLGSQFVADRFNSALPKLKAETEALRKTVETGVYPSVEAKNAAEAKLADNEYAIAALEYAQNLLNGTPAEDRLPELPADATPEQIAFQKRLQEQRDELDKTKQSSAKETRVKERKAYQSKIDLDYRKGVGRALDEIVAQEKQQGGFIPDFVLQERWVDPKTGQQTNVSSFAMNVLLEFNSKINAMPKVRDRLAQLQMLPPGPDAERAANEYYAELRTAYLPDIVKARVKKIQEGILSAQGQRQQNRDAAAAVASVEPRSGSTPAPQTLSKDQIHQQARINASKTPGFADLSPREQLEVELNERNKLQGLQ